MSELLVGGGFVSLVSFIFTIVFIQIGGVKKNIKDDMVNKKEYDGHKALCGNGFDHIKESLDSIRIENKDAIQALQHGQNQVQASISKIQKDIAVMVARAEERRQGDIDFQKLIDGGN